MAELVNISGLYCGIGVSGDSIGGGTCKAFERRGDNFNFLLFKRETVLFVLVVVLQNYVKKTLDSFKVYNELIS